MKNSLLLLIVLSVANAVYSQIPCPGTPIVSYAGKTYNTVQIGTQCWLKENLDVGTMVKGSQAQSNNAIIEKYCYENKIENCITYGGFYTWNEAMNYSKSGENVQGICPTGWKLPSYSEIFDKLMVAVSIDGNSLKALGQGTGTGLGTNTSGFSALLSGYIEYNGTTQQFSTTFNIWTSIELTPDDSKANSFALLSFTKSPQFLYSSKSLGYGVRCIKTTGTSIKETFNQNELPNTYSLFQNYPNPFNPTTTITYSIPMQTIVTVKIYDIIGMEIGTVVSGNKPAGTHSVEFNAADLASGIYFYTIQAGIYTQTKQMILLK